MKSSLHPFSGILIAILIAVATGRLLGQEDPGREKVGALSVSVYFATDGDPDAAGGKTQEIGEALRHRLSSEDRLRFAHYRAMGAETQAIFRSYENWAQPLKPSDEILVRFETRSQPGGDSVSLDIELWLARKKILKTDADLRPGRPLYVLGPEWRGGRLIIAVALAQ